MQENHITELLDGKPLDSLTGEEIAMAESHAAQCRECRRAYEAARVANALLLSRASEATEASPFFKTRVMAAIRERDLSPQVPAAVRMWRAAGALASTMGALLAILVALTIFTSGRDSQPGAIAVGPGIYSPEYVMLEQGDVDDEDLAYDEVVATMYELEDADGQ